MVGVKPLQTLWIDVWVSMKMLLQCHEVHINGQHVVRKTSLPGSRCGTGLCHVELWLSRAKRRGDPGPSCLVLVRGGSARLPRGHCQIEVPGWFAVMDDDEGDGGGGGGGHNVRYFCLKPVAMRIKRSPDVGCPVITLPDGETTR